MKNWNKYLFNFLLYGLQELTPTYELQKLTPTVVEAATIAADSLDLFIQKVQEEAKSNEFLNQLQEEDKYEMIKEVLTPEDYNFIVTPKEIDDLIENMKDVVARGINFATQK